MIIRFRTVSEFKKIWREFEKEQNEILLIALIALFVVVPLIFIAQTLLTAFIDWEFTSRNARGIMVALITLSFATVKVKRGTHDE